MIIMKLRSRVDATQEEDDLLLYPRNVSYETENLSLFDRSEP